jgi:L-lysine 6-oxidase
MNLSIHPSVGVARLGNSTTAICLSPDTIGGLPFDADNNGNSLGPITSFKDAAGLIKRQGQPFKILSDTGEEITLDTPNVASIEWTVHLANKKQRGISTASSGKSFVRSGKQLSKSENSFQKSRCAAE